jgi:D-sedoheptulose 7-phosphate isomerase
MAAAIPNSLLRIEGSPSLFGRASGNHIAQTKTLITASLDPNILHATAARYIAPFWYARRFAAYALARSSSLRAKYLACNATKVSTLRRIGGPELGERWCSNMQYFEQYRSELLNALRSVDLSAVDEILGIFREARAHGRCIFVCGTGANAVSASRLLCDMVRSSNINRRIKFRIFVIYEELAAVETAADGGLGNQLRNVASPGDVVVGISVPGNSPSVLQAVDYANQIGCRTICIAGWAGDQLASRCNAAIVIPASNPGNVEDAHMMICRMIGHYFLELDQN